MPCPDIPGNCCCCCCCLYPLLLLPPRPRRAPSPRPCNPFCKTGLAWCLSKGPPLPCLPAPRPAPAPLPRWEVCLSACAGLGWPEGSLSDAEGLLLPPLLLAAPCMFVTPVAGGSEGWAGGGGGGWKGCADSLMRDASASGTLAGAPEVGKVAGLLSVRGLGLDPLASACGRAVLRTLPCTAFWPCRCAIADLFVTA